MLQFALAAAGYGGYISVIKLGVFVLFFMGLMPLINWVHSDTQEVDTKVRFWTSLVTATGAITLLLMLFVPFFVVGLAIFLVATLIISIAYIVHRNSKVSDFEKVLTAEHIKGLFVDEDKKIAKSSKGISFVTANNNEVPLPSSKSPEAYGFKVAVEVFGDALWRRVSDIVFQPGPQQYSVIYRIDGLVSKQDGRPREEMEYFIHYLKRIADLDVEEKRKPQTGPFKVLKDGVSFDWQVTTAGSTAGEQIKFKRVEEYDAMKIPDIGLNENQLEVMQSLRDISKGLILVTGPKQSGVTSSFYAALRIHDPFMNDINSLERRPASTIENITQHIYSMTDTGTTTYAKRLQTIIRRGPNIIGVGDCDDPQTATVSCDSAKDGNIMYVSMEAASNMAALTQWLKWVADKSLVANTIVGIMNQRLVRKLCEDCRQAYQPNPELCRKFNMPAEKMKVLYRPGEIEYDKHGKPIVCEKCQGTGYYGRTGVFETIILNDKLKDAIKNAKSMQDLAKIFRKEGMLSLQEQAFKKVADGTTSINEVIRHFSGGQKAKPKS